MRFKLGDIVTGKGDYYAYTNKDSLMVVTDIKNNSEMTVLIVGHTYGRELKKEYSVCNNEKYFEITTFEEYTNSHSDISVMEEEYIQQIVNDLIAKAERQKPYVLSDEKRAELLEEMKELLTKYRYHPTDDGLNMILDEWCKNKADLIRLFEKHPNYNGKFQIVFDYDYDRIIDLEAIRDFKNWLIQDDVKGTLLKKIKIGVFEYEELVDICDRLYSLYRTFHRNYNIKTINGKTEKEFADEYLHFKKYKDAYDDNWTEVTICNGKAYTSDSYAKYCKVDNVYSVLNATYMLSQFVNDDAKYYFENYFPSAKIRKGQKLSRAINKILGMLGIDKLPDYNKEFAKFADAINPLKIKRHTVISCHPIDYFTMSFGNSWSSCQTIDKENDRGIGGDTTFRGCSSSGTMSYMLDGTSCLFYTIVADYNGNTLELEDKVNRCMFHYYDNQLVQGRVYPQSNDNGAGGLYKDIREIVQKVFADCLEQPNIWTNKSGTDACCRVISSSGTHYKDYANFDNCNVSTLKDDKEYHLAVNVGSYPICPHCGTVHSRTRNIECYDCNRRD